MSSSSVLRNNEAGTTTDFVDIILHSRSAAAGLASPSLLLFPPPSSLYHALRTTTTTITGTMQNTPPALLHFLSAGVAAGTACALFNPLDCLKVRWQLMPPPPIHKRPPSQKVTFLSHGLTIIKTEGLINGLWKPGLCSNVIGMSLSSGIRFTAYEIIRDSLPTSTSASNNNRNSTNHTKSGTNMFLAGFISGAFAYGITTPFHLIKTLIQADRVLVQQQQPQQRITNFRTGASNMIKKDGILSLFKGWQLLMMRGALFTSGQMLGYDGVKTLLSRENSRSSSGHSSSENTGSALFYMSDGPYLHMISSIFASFGASFFSTPADFVMGKYMSNHHKSSNTNSNSKNNNSVVRCIRDIYTRNGIVGFWRGWPIFFLRLTPSMLVYTTLFEQIRYSVGLGYMK